MSAVKMISTNNFVNEYISEARRCCESCYDKAINSQAWIAKAFESGWDMHEEIIAQQKLVSQPNPAPSDGGK